MKKYVVLFCVSLWGTFSFAQEIPHCSTPGDNIGICGRLLYLNQSMSLAPEQTFQCKLDFSACTESYINNWSLGVVEIRRNSSGAEARDIEFTLLDAASGNPIDMDAYGFYYDPTSIYIRRVLDSNTVWIANVKRKAAKRSTVKNYMMYSSGAISGR